MIDAVCCEPQFVDHAAPVWHALPASARGRFLVSEALVSRAQALGIDASPIPAERIRASSAPPRANPGDGPIGFVVSIGDTKVARRLGYRRFAFMEHGAGQAYIGDRGPTSRHPSYAGGADREDVGLFLVPNEYAASLWRRAYPGASVEVVGCPKLDTLPDRVSGDGPVVAISFHWPAQISPEAGTALGHYLATLPELAREFRVIGHAHPKADWPSRMTRTYARAGIPFVADFADVCRQADVYVCDNSSTLFEFAATGRPVVVLNTPQYRRGVHHGLRFWEAASVGVQVDHPRDLPDAIRRALADAPEQRAAREAALDLVYAYRSGAAERAADAITAWLGARVEVAA